MSWAALRRRRWSTDRCRFTIPPRRMERGQPLPDKVHHHGAVVIGGKIYVVAIPRTLPKRDPIDLTWVFDAATNIGTSGAAAIAARRPGGGRHRQPILRSRAASIYGPGTPVRKARHRLRAHHRFHGLRHGHRSLEHARAHEGRRDHAFVGVINDRLYVVGGRDGEYDIVTVEEFDPRAGLGASAPRCRPAAQAAMPRCSAASSMYSGAKAIRPPRPVFTTRSRPSSCTNG